MSISYLLQAENISKSFPGVKALDKVQLHIEKGKVHAVMGENGAGKSTLMKILIGMLSPDTGKILFRGEEIRFRSVHEAMKAGFSMIHQELFPFPELSIAENIFIGREPVTKIPGWIDKKKMYRNAQALMDKLGVAVKVERKMASLSIAQMQMVEIAKAISNRSEVIIMDEPTSAISGREVQVLFNVIRDLTSQGIAIIYISHKMDEILEIADTVTVMRDGKYIATHPAKTLNTQQLISMIVGRELNTIFEKRSTHPGEIVFSVSNLSGEKFHAINFDLRAGEIVGMAGLMGAGRTEIVQAIAGLEKIHGGNISIKGKPVNIRSPRDAIRNGIGLISEDRKRTGLVLSSSVKQNITLASLQKISKGQLLDLAKENAVAISQIKTFGIKTPSGNQVVNYLSGGNQQKVVLSKVLLNDPDIIIFDEPTRGIDIGAKAEIYKMMNALAERGKAIIMISSELIEVLGMSDRILVIRNGTVAASFNHAEASQEKIMQYAMA